MKYKNIILRVYFLVFVVLTWRVHVADCQVPDEEMMKNQPPKTEAGNATGNLTKEQLQKLEELDKPIEIPPMPFITYGPYTFENLTEELIPEVVDCDELFIQCIQNTVMFSRVCAYVIDTHELKDYDYLCLLELLTCTERVKNGKSMYAGVETDSVYYNGEGYKCAHYLRSENGPRSHEEAVALYYGGHK